MDTSYAEGYYWGVGYRPVVIAHNRHRSSMSHRSLLTRNECGGVDKAIHRVGRRVI